MRVELRPWREMVGIVATMIGTVYVLAAINTAHRSDPVTTIGSGAIGVGLFAWGAWMTTARSPSVELYEKLRKVKPVVGKSLGKIRPALGKPITIAELEGGIVVMTWEGGERCVTLTFHQGVCSESVETNR